MKLCARRSLFFLRVFRAVVLGVCACFFFVLIEVIFVISSFDWGTNVCTYVRFFFVSIEVKFVILSFGWGTNVCAHVRIMCADGVFFFF